MHVPGSVRRPRPSAPAAAKSQDFLRRRGGSSKSHEINSPKNSDKSACGGRVVRTETRKLSEPVFPCCLCSLSAIHCSLFRVTCSGQRLPVIHGPQVWIVVSFERDLVIGASGHAIAAARVRTVAVVAYAERIAPQERLARAAPASAVTVPTCAWASIASWPGVCGRESLWSVGHRVASSV